LDRVKGKVAVITGGAEGVGRADCLLLAKEGAKVAVTDINDSPGKEVVSEIKNSGGVAKFWHMDVTDESEVMRIFADIAGKFGKIDVLVNNAGIEGYPKATHEYTEAEWDKVMNVNVKGVFFCTKHVVPYMKKAGTGSIVNMSSIGGIAGHAVDPAYHASKAAVRLMTKVDAICYGKDKIRVNSVHPSIIVTPMVERFADKFPGGRDAYRQARISTLPIGYLGEPIDVAYGVLYLASDESRFVTGTELIIDGGYLAQ